MNNTFLIIITLSALLVSCKENKTNSQPINDNNQANKVDPVQETSTGPFGDLAHLDLYGPVKTMHYYGDLYQFDKDGKLTFDAEINKEEIEEDGETYLCYQYHDGGWENWSSAKPYDRAYKANGQLAFVSVGYEDRTEIEYNSDGTVAKEYWVSESWDGENIYTYSKESGLTRRVKLELSMRECEEVEHEKTIDTYVAYHFDTHGNWLRRFVVSKCGDTYTARLDTRELTYYDDAPEGQYQDLNDRIFTGNVGGEKAALCLVDEANGYFFFNRNDNTLVRKFEVDKFDKESGEFSFSAQYINGDKLGKFEGTLINGVLKGVFTNTSNKSVTMSFSESLR